VDGDARMAAVRVRARCARPHFAGEALLETWLRRGAHGVKPAADVHLGVGFVTGMLGSGCCGSFRLSSAHGKLGVSTSHYKPVDGITGRDSTNFTSEFPQRCHGFIAYVSAGRRYFAAEACRGHGVSTVNSPTCSLFTVPRRWAAWSIIQSSGMISPTRCP
jgi:hypothetical protein